MYLICEEGLFKIFEGDVIHDSTVDRAKATIFTTEDEALTMIESKGMEKFWRVFQLDGIYDPTDLNESAPSSMFSALKRKNKMDLLKQEREVLLSV